MGVFALSLSLSLSWSGKGGNPSSSHNNNNDADEALKEAKYGRDTLSEEKPLLLWWALIR